MVESFEQSVERITGAPLRRGSSFVGFHHDHLGSLSVITNTQGAVTERLAYDAWGKRRHVDGQRDTLEVLTAQSTQRGYTMHEHMDQIGVINMNGRVYDPLIGRFLSADPHIQHPDDLQSFNRYSYVKNNPLAFTDPSGYFLKKLFKAIVKIVVVVAVVMVLTAVVGAAVGALMGAAANTAVVGSLALGKLVTAGIVNGIVSAASAGSGKAFWGGFISGAAFSFAGGLGDRFGTPGSYAGHAGAGCISAVAGGGKCGQGAMNALAGKLTSTTLRTNGMGAEGGVGGFMGGLVATSLAGGVMSELQGVSLKTAQKLVLKGIFTTKPVRRSLPCWLQVCQRLILC
ncbi:MAG: RHS repeat-associated core domain-containing protein [Burkholderiaceae bacterium]